MAGINTLILNQGIGKAIEAQNNQGFNILLPSFGVSEIPGTLDINRTTPNTEWFKTTVTTALKIDDNTIQLTCVIPPNATDRQTNLPVTGPREIAEVYVYGLDQNSDEFLFSLSKPEFVEMYDPQGSYELRIQLKILNVTVDSVYRFEYTQAQEIALHDESPIAHPGLFWTAETKTENFDAIGNKVYLINHAPSESVITVKLPIPELGKKVCIKDILGEPSNKKIFIESNDGESIDGLGVPYQFKSPFESRTLMSDGVNWFFIWSEQGKQPTSQSGVVNLGDPNLAGSWRLKVDGGNLLIEHSTGNGVFVTVDTLNP